jgi:acetylornithine deacetylase/succinyl-diaminopimelate desuccinylase-like protein
MLSPFLRLALLLSATLAAPALAQPISPDQLRRHIDILAHDALEGRFPGSVGEQMTTKYISNEMKAIGLEPGGNKGTWFHEVKLPVPGKPASRFPSNNVIGRLRGSGKTGESVVFLAHWDHVGICGHPSAKDRICNGAIDNASGVASMLEIARVLAKGPRPVRDILFIATTGEEMGLLGAAAYAAKPTVPLDSIVAALNLDTVAIAPRGRPVSVIGRGKVAALDALVEETVLEQGRSMDRDRDVDAFAQRQDGFAFVRKGVPAIDIGGAFSSMKDVRAYMEGPYHQPGDNPGPHIELGGAAEDADLHVLLARKLADPARYQRPR